LTVDTVIARLISTKGNIMCEVKNYPGEGFVVIHKKYFNQIHQLGQVEGRIRKTEDGLNLFEGFNWR